MSVMDQPNTLPPSIIPSSLNSVVDRKAFSCFLLDANPKTRFSMVEALADQGYALFEFNTLERFQSLVVSEPVGLVIARIHVGNSVEKLAQLDHYASEAEPLKDFIRDRGWKCPVLLISDSQDVRECSAAYQAGVLAYFQAPISSETLVEQVEIALSRCNERKLEIARNREVAEKLNRLTTREREILNLLVAGQSMKAIASNSGTSFQAVARHRQRILEKLRLEGDVALVRWYFNLAAQ